MVDVGPRHPLRGGDFIRVQRKSGVATPPKEIDVDECTLLAKSHYSREMIDRRVEACFLTQFAACALGAALPGEHAARRELPHQRMILDGGTLRHKDATIAADDTGGGDHVENTVTGPIGVPATMGPSETRPGLVD